MTNLERLIEQVEQSRKAGVYITGYANWKLNGLYVKHGPALVEILQRLVETNEHTDTGIANWAEIWDEGKQVLSQIEKEAGA